MGKNDRFLASSLAPGTAIGVLSLAALFLLATVACAGGGPAGSSEEALTLMLPPGSVSPSANPLVAQYTIAPNAQAMVTIRFGPTSNYGFTTSSQSTSSNGGSVTVLVAGMKQNTLYHMQAIVTYGDGSRQLDSDHIFQTGGVPPSRMPVLTIATGSGLTPAPGIELMSLTPADQRLTCLATDPNGNVIWYYDYDWTLGIPQPIKLLPNGHMLMVLYAQGSPGGILREVDLAGNTIQQLTYTQLNQELQAAGYNISVYSVDHDLVYLSNRHVLIIVSDTRVFTDLKGYPGQTTVVGDAVVDLDPNYNVAWVWDAFDHLDVNRHPMYFPDWLHANALAYSPDDGNLLLSLRHQSWVIKIDYQNGNGTGNVLWRLGDGGDFVFGSGTPDWFYAQHDANIVSPNSTGDFQIGLFDNGNYRDGDQNSFTDNGMTCAPGNPPLCYSAPSIFEVNETTMSATRQWTYVTPFSFWGGVTTRLPNSNVFLDQTAPGFPASTGSRIMEVTQTASPTVVWQMVTQSQDSYRTIHLTSLYPGVQW